MDHLPIYMQEMQGKESLTWTVDGVWLKIWAVGQGVGCPAFLASLWSKWRHYGPCSESLDESVVVAVFLCVWYWKNAAKDAVTFCTTLVVPKVSVSNSYVF